MQLYGYRNHSDGRYYILANIYSTFVRNSQRSVVFMIDSGSTITTISYMDALQLEVNYNSLSNESKIGTGGGTVPVLILPGAISFMLPDNRTAITEFQLQFFVPNPASYSSQNAGDIWNFGSVLGMDFLSRYRLTLQNNFCILEK